jgi:beta-glucosidase
LRRCYDTGEDLDQAAATAAAADVAVVVVADAASESTDKPCMGLNCGSSGNYDRDALIERVAGANPRTVVVLETAAPVLTPWRGRVAGLLEAWYPGVAGGTAIARLLFGDVNPSGRLPATFPKSEGDMPYAGDPEAYPGVLERVVYKEGVVVGYRWFDEKGIEPAYPFGHGLSYTSFRYGNLRIRERRDGTVGAAVDVTNTGGRVGAEVAQLYLDMPDPGAGVLQPPKALRGFRRLSLRPRQTRTARFRLTPRDLSYWNVGASDWRVAPGCYAVMVGASSRDIRLEATFGRGGARCPRAASACLSRRAPLGPRGVGRVRLRKARRALRRLPGLRRRGRRTVRYCVRGGRGAVKAVLSRRGRSRLVLTTAPGHRFRGLRPGLRFRLAPRAVSRDVVLGRGLYRVAPRSPRLFGVRRGRVRFIGVADRRLLGKPAALRAYVRRAGV